MSIFATIRAYALIVEFVDTVPGVSAPEIINRLEDHDIEISKRTFERYLNALRTDFHIDISYEPTRRGYVIHKDDNPNYERLRLFLDTVEQSMVISEEFQDGSNPLQFIDFSRSQRVKGLKWFKPLLIACRQDKKVIVTYHKYGSTGEVERKISPLRLKQYQDRWYILGWSDNDDDMRTYALDRIAAVKLLQTKRKVPKLDLDKLFHDTVGINYGNGQPVDVEFSIANGHADYLESLPLHHSQEIVVRTDRQTTFRLRVIENFELAQRLLAYGGDIEIIKPESLKKRLERFRIDGIWG